MGVYLSSAACCPSRCQRPSAAGDAARAVSSIDTCSSQSTRAVSSSPLAEGPQISNNELDLVDEALDWAPYSEKRKRVRILLHSHEVLRNFANKVIPKLRHLPHSPNPKHDTAALLIAVLSQLEGGFRSLEEIMSAAFRGEGCTGSVDDETNPQPGEELLERNSSVVATELDAIRQELDASILQRMKKDSDAQVARMKKDSDAQVARIKKDSDAQVARIKKDGAALLARQEAKVNARIAHDADNAERFCKWMCHRSVDSHAKPCISLGHTLRTAHPSMSESEWEAKSTPRGFTAPSASYAHAMLLCNKYELLHSVSSAVFNAGDLQWQSFDAAGALAQSVARSGAGHPEAEVCRHGSEVASEASSALAMRPTSAAHSLDTPHTSGSCLWLHVPLAIRADGHHFASSAATLLDASSQPVTVANMLQPEQPLEVQDVRLCLTPSMLDAMRELWMSTQRQGPRPQILGGAVGSGKSTVLYLLATLVALYREEDVLFIPHSRFLLESPQHVIAAAVSGSSGPLARAIFSRCTWHTGRTWEHPKAASATLQALVDACGTSSDSGTVGVAEVISAHFGVDGSGIARHCPIPIVIVDEVHELGLPVRSKLTADKRPEEVLKHLLQQEGCITGSCHAAMLFAMMPADAQPKIVTLESMEGADLSKLLQQLARDHSRTFQPSRSTPRPFLGEEAMRICTLLSSNLRAVWKLHSDASGHRYEGLLEKGGYAGKKLSTMRTDLSSCMGSQLDAVLAVMREVAPCDFRTEWCHVYYLAPGGASLAAAASGTPPMSTALATTQNRDTARDGQVPRAVVEQLCILRMRVPMTLLCFCTPFVSKLRDTTSIPQQWRFVGEVELHFARVVVKQLHEAGQVHEAQKRERHNESAVFDALKQNTAVSALLDPAKVSLLLANTEYTAESFKQKLCEQPIPWSELDDVKVAPEHAGLACSFAEPDIMNQYSGSTESVTTVRKEQVNCVGPGKRLSKPGDSMLVHTAHSFPAFDMMTLSVDEAARVHTNIIETTASKLEVHAQGKLSRDSDWAKAFVLKGVHSCWFDLVTSVVLPLYAAHICEDGSAQFRQLRSYAEYEELKQNPKEGTYIGSIVNVQLAILGIPLEASLEFVDADDRLPRRTGPARNGRQGTPPAEAPPAAATGTDGDSAECSLEGSAADVNVSDGRPEDAPCFVRYEVKPTSTNVEILHKKASIDSDKCCFHHTYLSGKSVYDQSDHFFTDMTHNSCYRIAFLEMQQCNDALRVQQEEIASPSFTLELGVSPIATRGSCSPVGRGSPAQVVLHQC